MKKELKLSDIKFKPPLNINYGLSVFAISDILRHPEQYNIDYNVYLPSKGKNLQRPFCWSLFQKQELILSVLKGIQLPVLTIIQLTEDYKNRDKKVYKIMDGKQRLSTLISFVKGEFPIIYNDEKYYFKDLDSWGQGLLKNYRIKADVGYEYPDTQLTDDEKIAWFEVINFAGVPQDKEHLKQLKQ